LGGTTADIGTIDIRTVDREVKFGGDGGAIARQSLYVKTDLPPSARTKYEPRGIVFYIGRRYAPFFQTTGTKNDIRVEIIDIPTAIGQTHIRDIGTNGNGGSTVWGILCLQGNRAEQKTTQN
jgi:hypothetical protein